jgi:osmotically-inducible protein OsmY
MKRFTAVTAVAMLAFATACSNTAKGVEKDADNMGDKAAAATDRAGDATANATSDAGNGMASGMNTADVKAALLAEQRLRATDINVESDDATKTLSLNGSVPTAEQKQMAEDVAKAKAPEYKIVNNLTIKPN